MDNKKRKVSDYEKETTREVIFAGKSFRVRKLPPSKFALKGLGMRTQREIVGHMPVEPLELQKKFALQRAEILREMALMTAIDRERFINKGPIDFVTDKGDRQKYNIFCGNCGEKVAYVWAENDKLDNWVDLHYICRYDKSSWYGARAINVSPIDGKLGIECCCGEDTRDFRTNRTMAPIQKRLMIEYALKHREFGSPESKFAAVAI